MRFLCLIVLFVFAWVCPAIGKPAIVELTNITKESKAKHTRIIFQLDKKPEFNIIPDPGNKRILLNIPNVRVPFHVDRNLEDELMRTYVSVSGQSNEINVFISMKKDPFSFHYFLFARPYRIVIDLKERDVDKVRSLQKYRKPAAGGTTPGPLKKVVEISNRREEKRKKVEQYEKKVFISPTIDEERRIYSLGLREFARENYEKAIEAMKSLKSNYPASRYVGNSRYIVAESYSGLMKNPPPPKEDELPVNYEQKAMNAYRIAISKDPENHRRESALFRTANIYLKQKKNLEAGSMLQMLVEEFPKGQFAPRALLARAKLFSREKRFDEAYNELEKVLFLYPFSPVIRGATFNIADSYYLEKDFKKAVDIYSQAVKKWPSYPKANPDTLFFMGDAYFHEGDFKEAQKRFFQLVNLYPAWTFTPQALERLGDIYKRKGKFRESIKMYSFVVNNYPGDEAFNRSLVRLADLGRERQGSVGNGKIFDYSAYEEPQKTYSEILKSSPDSDAGRDSLFGSGKVYKNSKQYLLAIERFEEFITIYSKEELAVKSKGELREIFFDLIEKYHEQEGFFQVLLTYYKNFEQFFIELKEPELLFEIGNSYRAFGLYGKAIEMFTAASTFDKREKIAEAILFRTSESLVGLSRVREAEKGLRKLLRKYKSGRYVKKARMLLGESLMDQKRYGEAISVLSKYTGKYKNDQGSAKAYYLTGLAEEKRRRYRSAVSQFRNALKQISRYPQSDLLKQQKANIQFKIVKALYKGREYRKVIDYTQALKKGYIADSRLQWARYLEAESYRHLKEEDKSKGILTMLAGLDDKLLKSVAAVEADYLTWKEEHPDLFNKNSKSGAKTGRKK